MKKLVFSLLIAAISAFCADEALPKAETILDKYIDAVGGKAAFEKHRTEVMHGTIEFTGRGLKGTMTVYQAAPDKNRSVLELEGIGKIESGSNGEIAWDNSALQGARIKQGIEKADSLRDGVFNSSLFWRKLYSKVETTGSENVEGHDCYKVVLTPAEGSSSTHFYDKKSGLLIKTATRRTTQMGEISAEVIADDYRKEGDILTPHKMTNRFSGQEFVLTVNSVEYNTDLQPGVFDLPPEVAALLKKSAAAPAPPAKGAPAASAGAANGSVGKLTVYMMGKPVATENYSIKKSGGTIAMDGSGNATMGTMKIDIDQFRVVTDDKYKLIEAAAQAKLGQIAMNVKTTFADGKAKSIVDTGQGPTNREDNVDPGAIVVNANLPLYPWSFLAMRADFKSSEPQQFQVYVLGQGEVPATVVFKGREPVEFATKTVELNHVNATGKMPQGGPISLDLWLDDDHRIVKLAVPSMGVEAYQDGYDRRTSAETPKPDAAKGDSKSK